jgi:hypothetical protein
MCLDDGQVCIDVLPQFLSKGGRQGFYFGPLSPFQAVFLCCSCRARRRGACTSPPNLPRWHCRGGGRTPGNARCAAHARVAVFHVPAVAFRRIRRELLDRVLQCGSFLHKLRAACEHVVQCLRPCLSEDLAHRRLLVPFAGEQILHVAAQGPDVLQERLHPFPLPPFSQGRRCGRRQTSSVQ